MVLNLGRIGTFSREYIVVLVSRIPCRISGQTFNAAARTQWTWPSSSGFEDQSFEISAILRNSRLVQRYGLTLSFAVSFIFRSFSSYSIYFFVGLFSCMFFLSSNFLSMVTLLLVLFSRFLPCTRKVCDTKTYDCNGERSFDSIESIADEWPLVKADIPQWAKLWVRKASEHDGRCKDEIYQSRPIYGTKWNLSARTSPYRLLLHAQNILRYFRGTRFSIGRT